MELERRETVFSKERRDKEKVHMSRNQACIDEESAWLNARYQAAQTKAAESTPDGDGGGGPDGSGDRPGNPPDIRLATGKKE